MNQKPNNNNFGSLMNPVPNESVVDQIITRITDAIISGELQPGQKIPTENSLSEAMNVGRNSVREAIKVLEAMGVLNIRRPEGTFVAEGFSDRMLNPMIYGLILEGGSSPAMIELRQLFDVGILKLAIEKATEKDIKHIFETLTELRKVVQKQQPDKNEILDADIMFHRALEAAVKNPLVNKIGIVIERLSYPTRARAVEQFIRNGELNELLEMHEQMLNVVIERNEAVVGQIIDEHYKYWKEELHK
ncbi:Regulatory protein GntR HTH [Tepidanaerobacter acetatoxydans Re1]|uniref:Regulatory protein GntR HTH n=1 Tax=Tepidanaerobacter acetatoxydans (strain DSM 21804 / JCM 16047 / Re1) TaxID=1209989 RepID=F4LQS8_TEPAE|nr:GntR family transcriptional regulator [Tepidanaerobacter acetatoxydans]AEE92081.1 regulatory protein GntR HTH [Tepidanaerobacter acetatoxydans Re1]CCP26927.1 Regulatory protein GntR HTH [Tepidanaerobacter acetatoxydans Re1]